MCIKRISCVYHTCMCASNVCHVCFTRVCVHHTYIMCVSHVHLCIKRISYVFHTCMCASNVYHVCITRACVHQTYIMCVSHVNLSALHLHHSYIIHGPLVYHSYILHVPCVHGTCRMYEIQCWYFQVFRLFHWNPLNDYSLNLF